MARPKNDPADIFKYIDTKDGDTEKCWPWTGAMGGRDMDRGYFSVDGKKWLAYRLVWTIARGDIPEGMMVRHKCDNPMCCNPFHMELGTQGQNERDKYDRDRAGLPVAAVREIKRMLQVSSWTQAQIAYYVSQRFDCDVSREAVRNIKLGVRRASANERTTDEILSEAGAAINVAEEDAVDTDRGEVDTGGAVGEGDER